MYVTRLISFHNVETSVAQGDYRRNTMLCLALLLPLAWAAQADPTCESNDAKGTSLLSLKADAVRSRDTRDIFADVVSTFADNATAANDSNASWQRVNQSLHQSVQDLVTCLQSFV